MANEDFSSAEKCLAAVRRNGEALMDVPEELKTPEVCMAAVKQSGVALEWVPEALKTQELCMAAVMEDGNALEFVPEAVMNEGMCLIAVRKEGDQLGCVPDRLKTKRVCMAAWNSEEFCEFSFMPEEMITPEMVLEYLSKYPGMIDEIPDKFKTEAVCTEFIFKSPGLAAYLPESALTMDFIARTVSRWASAYCRSSGKSPKFNERSAEFFAALPERLRREAIADLRETAFALAKEGRCAIFGRIPRVVRDEDFNAGILEINGEEITALDDDELTEKVCRAALKSWPAGLGKVPSKLRTADICLDCARRVPGTLKAAPAKLKTEELCLEAVRRDGLALEWVPEKLKTEKICTAAARAADGRVLKFVPEALQSKAKAAFRDMRKEDFLANVRLRGRLLEYVPAEMRSPDICMEAVRQDGMALEWVPKKLKTEELCLEAVRSGRGEALQFVPEKLKTLDMCIEASRRAPSYCETHSYVPYRLKEAVWDRLEEIEEKEAEEAGRSAPEA